MRRVQEVMLADVDADVVIPREEHQVARAQMLEAHLSADHPVLEVGAVRQPEPALSPGGHHQAGAVVRTRPGAAPLIGLADLPVGEPDGPVALRLWAFIRARYRS